MRKIRLNRLSVQEVYDQIDARIEESFDTYYDSDTIMDIDDSSESRGWLMVFVTVAFKDLRPSIRRSFLVRKDQYELYGPLVLNDDTKVEIETY